MSNDVATFRGGSEIFCNEFAEMRLVQCIIDLQSISLLNLLGVSKTVEIGAA
jgi:hypothetical protein